MKQQTAVSWLEEELKLNLKKVILEGNSKLIESLFEQAKEMEKEQIEDAYDEGDNNGADRIYYHSNRDDKSAEQYYNETFKSE